jgi:hypothetical protein
MTKITTVPFRNFAKAPDNYDTRVKYVLYTDTNYNNIRSKSFNVGGKGKNKIPCDLIPLLAAEGHKDIQSLSKNHLKLRNVVFQFMNMQQEGEFVNTGRIYSSSQ